MTNSSPILQSKLAPPPAPPIVLDSATLDLYVAGSQRRLLLIKAPAGYGKTSVTSFIAKQLGWRVAWYTLDHLDNDPLIFMRSLLTAVRTPVPAFGESLYERLCQSENERVEPSEALILLAAAFEAEADDHLHVVLDDYHEARSTQVVRVLDYLLALRGCAAHFIVLTRYDAGLQIAKLRLGGELAEIGAADLRFTTEQAAEVVKLVSGRSPSPDELERLMDVTEGWPASVVLAGRFPEEVEPRGERLHDPRLKGDVYSYLAEQVYNREAQEIRTFLKLSCCLDQMTAELAQMTTGIQDAHRHLAYLAENSVFTFRTEKGEFRYHPLFRDYLRHRITEEDGMAAYRDTQLKAGKASEMLGDLDGAIELYLDAGDGEAATRVLAEAGDAVLQSATEAQLERWANRLPPQTPLCAAWRALLNGQTHVNKGDHKAATTRLRGARERFCRAGHTRGTYLAAAAIEHALFWKGDYPAAAAACRDALATCSTDTERAHILASLGSALLNVCDWSGAYEAWQQALALLDDVRDLERLRIECQQIAALGVRGRFSSARQMACALRRDAERQLPSTVLPAFLNVQALAHLHMSEYQNASECLDYADSESRRIGYWACQHLLLDTRGQLEAALGNRAKASGYLEMALGHRMNRGDVASRAMVLSHLGTIHRRANELEDAERRYRDAVDLLNSSRTHSARLTCEINYEYVRSLVDDNHSLRRLRELQCEASACGLLFLTHKVPVFEAVLAERRGGRDEAVRGIGEVLASSLLLGHRHFIAQELATTPELLEALFKSIPDPETLASLAMAIASHPEAMRLLSRALGGSEASSVAILDAAAMRLNATDVTRLAKKAVRSRAPSVRRRANEILAASGREACEVPELTRREAEVLQLMASGLRNEEIAQRLFLSPLTVKSYVNRIFTKLGITDRVHAVLYYTKTVHAKSD